MLPSMSSLVSLHIWTDIVSFKSCGTSITTKRKKEKSLWLHSISNTKHYELFKPMKISPGLWCLQKSPYHPSHLLCQVDAWSWMRCLAVIVCFFSLVVAEGCLYSLSQNHLHLLHLYFLLRCQNRKSRYHPHSSMFSYVFPSEEMRHWNVILKNQNWECIYVQYRKMIYKIKLLRKYYEGKLIIKYSFQEMLITSDASLTGE